MIDITNWLEVAKPAHLTSHYIMVGWAYGRHAHAHASPRHDLARHTCVP
jgi:hypothetical protein